MGDRVILVCDVVVGIATQCLVAWGLCLEKRNES